MEPGMKPADRNTGFAVEDALRTYPLADPPGEFNAQVMRRIARLTPRPSRLVTWVDAVIALSLALSTGAMAFGLAALPPIVDVHWRVQVALFAQFIWLNLAWVASGAVILAGLLLLAWSLARFWPGQKPGRIS